MDLNKDSAENKLEGNPNDAVRNEGPEGEGDAQNTQGEFQETMGDLEHKLAQDEAKAATNL